MARGPLTCVGEVIESGTLDQAEKYRQKAIECFVTVHPSISSHFGAGRLLRLFV